MQCKDSIFPAYWRFGLTGLRSDRGILEIGMGSSGYSFTHAGRVLAVLLVCGTFAAGCSKKEQAKPVGQVVARVGNEVVTTPELENEFRALNIPADKQKDPALVKRVLGELVTRKYLLQQAMTAKLDREPSVLLDTLRSREQVLASAYLTRAAANKASAISKADIDKYIANNPSKFANRQIVAAEQITFSIGSNLQAIIDATKGSKSLDDIDQKLTAMSVPHNRAQGSFNSAEVPEEISKLIEANKAGDVFFLRAGSNGVFMKVMGEESRPLGGENAVSLARQIIKTDLLKAEAGMASVAASFEAKYEGEYSKVMTDKSEGPSTEKN
jgi:EpsD family peptidyl-prolyl cis-trans isomerase